MSLTYKDAGVDIGQGMLVEKIKARVAQTCGPRVVSGVGGFACLYDVDGERLLAAGTVVVVTKLMVAQRLGIHNTIGIDLVAMCINDILCTGARGLFFMDYLATGSGCECFRSDCRGHRRRLFAGKSGAHRWGNCRDARDVSGREV